MWCCVFVAIFLLKEMKSLACFNLVCMGYDLWELCFGFGLKFVVCVCVCGNKARLRICGGLSLHVTRPQMGLRTFCMVSDKWTCLFSFLDFDSILCGFSSKLDIILLLLTRTTQEEERNFNMMGFLEDFVRLTLILGHTNSRFALWPMG